MPLSVALHDGIIFVVVGAAICPDLLHILQYFSGREVRGRLCHEVLFDGAQIHGLSYDLMVVMQPQGLGIHLQMGTCVDHAAAGTGHACHKKTATIDLSTITGRHETVLSVAAVGLASQLITLWQHLCYFLIIMQTQCLLNAAA